MTSQNSHSNGQPREVWTAPTRARCCKCGAPLCAEHSRELAVQFFVPTVACVDERTCHSRAPKRRSYEREDEVMTPWGMSVKRYLG